MLGTNKTGAIHRLNGIIYEEVIPEIKFRFEHEMFLLHRYTNKAQHITYTLSCDIMDLKLKDKLIFDNKEYVFAGVSEFTELYGSHLECIVRQMASSTHTLVTVRSKAETQSSYDPIFKEYTTGEAEYTEREIYILADSQVSGREFVVQYTPQGKLDETDYIITVDFPDALILTIDDKIIMDNIIYDIKWMNLKEFELLVGLQKSSINYKSVTEL